MRDGILTEESYRNVARCPPMTLNVSVVSCVGRSPYMYAKKARARRPHGRPHGRTPTSCAAQVTRHRLRRSRPLSVVPGYRSLIGLSAPRGVARHRSSTSIVPYKRCGRVSARSPPPAGAWTIGGGCAAPSCARGRAPTPRPARPARVDRYRALPALLFCRQRRRCSVVTPALVSCDSIEHTSTQ